MDLVGWGECDNPFCLSVVHIDPIPVVTDYMAKKSSRRWMEQNAAKLPILQQILDLESNNKDLGVDTVPLLILIEAMVLLIQSGLSTVHNNDLSLLSFTPHPMSIGEDRANVSLDIFKLAPKLCSVCLSSSMFYRIFQSSVLDLMQSVAQLDGGANNVMELASSHFDNDGIIHLTGRSGNNFDIFAYSNLVIQLKAPNLRPTR